jgi:hypothetical protein
MLSGITLFPFPLFLIRPSTMNKARIGTSGFDIAQGNIFNRFLASRFNMHFINRQKYLRWNAGVKTFLLLLNFF